MLKVLDQYGGFQWDEGNRDKNLLKHQVSDKECEEVFFDNGKRIFQDKIHPSGEDRFVILGKTFDSRLLYAVFTVRSNTIRVISARDINKKEIHLYEKTA